MSSIWGTIPLHIGASRVTQLGQPDWCILDLDPKTAPFVHVVQVARAVYALCKKVGLPAFVKNQRFHRPARVSPAAGRFEL